MCKRTYFKCAKSDCETFVGNYKDEKGKNCVAMCPSDTIRSETVRTTSRKCEDHRDRPGERSTADNCHPPNSGGSSHHYNEHWK